MSRTPDINRSFQLTDLEANSNKYWIIRAWDEGGTWKQVVTFGRTGSSKQERSKRTTLYDIRKLIRSKLRKGYRELDLSESEVGIIDAPPSVEKLVRAILKSAGEEIKSYLATDINNISLQQIARARRQLQAVSREPTLENVNLYFKLVPTKLPSRIEPDEVIKEITGDLHKQEERLDNIEATIGSRSTDSVDLLDICGARIEEVPASEVEEVWNHPSDVVRVFSVDSKNDEFESVGNDSMLWHGTRLSNMVHILRSGLIVPGYAANGSMFGRGIYFASDTVKSMHYSSSNLMFLASVSLGKPLVADMAMDHLKEAPTGYDSVHGKAGHTKSWGGTLSYDEFIVYRRPQQKIRYIVEWR